MGLYYFGFLPPVVALLSNIGANEDRLDSIGSTQVGGMVNAPSSQQ